MLRRLDQPTYLHVTQAQRDALLVRDDRAGDTYFGARANLDALWQLVLLAVEDSRAVLALEPQSLRDLASLLVDPSSQ